MSTADGRNDSGLVRPDGSLWKRREFVTALGAGLLAACPDNQSSTADDRPTTVKIRFYGAFLVTHALDGSYEVLMPKATHAPAGQHDDTSLAIPHNPFLGIYSKHEDSSYKNAYAVPGRNLRFEGNMSIIPSSFVGLAPLEGILPKKDFSFRKYDGITSEDYASRMTFVNGTFRTELNNTAHIRFAPTLNADAPQDTYLAKYLEWDSGKAELEVGTTGDSTGIPKPLKASRHPAIVIAHLPHHIPPKEIYKKATIPVGTVDHDFKWLFRAFYPDGEKDSEYPWKKLLMDRVLPAPEVIALERAANSQDDPEVEIVGSPNCFGGCFGCT
jgi:hypothetical protein